MTNNYKKPIWNAWYKTAKWQRRRLLQLSVQPLCELCEKQGLVTAASVADHKEPHKGDLNKFWNGELNSLCSNCHNSIKQRYEKTGILNLGFDIHGMPKQIDGEL